MRDEIRNLVGDLMVGLGNRREDNLGDGNLRSDQDTSSTPSTLPDSGEETPGPARELEESRNLLEAAIQAKRLARAETAQIEAELIHLLDANTKMREELTRIQASRSYRGSQRMVRLLRQVGLKSAEPHFHHDIDD